MKFLAALPLLCVPLLWIPCGLAGSVVAAWTGVAPSTVTGAVTCAVTGAATAKVADASDGPDQIALPTGFTVEYPAGPVMLGSPFELMVRGPDLQSLHLGVEDHIGDVIVGRVMRRNLTADGSEGRADATPAETGDATGPATGTGAMVELRRSVTIARAGDYSMPLAVVNAAGETTDLPPLEMSVLLDIPDGHRAQVSDLMAPVPVPVPPASPWPFILGALAALGLLGWLVVAEGREKPVYVYHPPADRVAMEALADLRERLPKTREEIRPFLIRVSDVLRVYIESVFQMHAPALTTEEFLAQAAHRHDALSERRDALAGFLQQCDLVKYAGERPAPATAEPLLSLVETFVEETRGAVAEPPEPDAVTGVLSPADRARLEARQPVQERVAATDSAPSPTTPPRDGDPT